MKRNHVQFFQQELFTRSFMEEMTALAPIKAIISFGWLLEDLLIVWRTYISTWCIQGCWDPALSQWFCRAERGFVSLIRATKEILLSNKIIFSYSPECKDVPGQMIHSSMALSVPQERSLVPRDLKERSSLIAAVKVPEYQLVLMLPIHGNFL